jgi:hypothetical protein
MSASFEVVDSTTMLQNNNVTTINRTCDACSISKVKCSGTQPCTRCTSRGVDCFYRARKKRSVKNISNASSNKNNSSSSELLKKVKPLSSTSGVKNPPSLASSSSSPSSTTVTSPTTMTTNKGADLTSSAGMLPPNWDSKRYLLSQQERKSWTVFFSLYRNYGANCMRFWFERQLLRMKLRLQKSPQKGELLALLDGFAESLDVDFEKVKERGACCQKAMNDPNSNAAKLAHQGGLHLHVDCKVGTHCDHSAKIMDPAAAARTPVGDLLDHRPTTARLKITTSGKFPDDVASVTVNEAFESLFGLSQSNVAESINVMGSGLLPWGGDALCSIVPSNADIFAFMQICAINLNWSFITLDKSKFPIVREVPSAHVMAVQTSRVAEAVPCLVKCVHREFIDLCDGGDMEITMTFEPLVPLPEPTTFSNSNMVASPNSARLFEQELPLADDETGDNVESGLQALELNENEIFFPEVDLNSADDTFLKDLLDFARIDDDNISIH